MAERASKRRRVDAVPRKERLFPSTNPADDNAHNISDSSFAYSASRWDLEQDYEHKSRKKREAKVNTRLPIKTADGRLEQFQAAAPEIGPDKASNSFDEEKAYTELSVDDGPPTAPRVPVRQQILEAKEELARIATLMNEDPEEHIGALRTLSNITASEVTTVAKLGLATQLAVYKDVIPGYRIRPVADDEMKGKLSKDVRKMRNFEQNIVRGYQRYVQELARIAALRKVNASEEVGSLSTVAVSCACNLLTSVPHFNFRTELLKVLTEKLASGPSSPDFEPSRVAFQRLFEEDDDGNASLEAVSTLSKMMKGKHFRIHEDVLNLFLHLRLLSEFQSKASTSKVDKADQVFQVMGKKAKQKREFRTKRERKVMKERRSIEKEMQEADAQVSYEQRDKIQAETLKLVFAVYFRILKAKTPRLMGPVLEGLVKYAHLINQDFFGDLLESLKDLVREAEAPDDADESENESAVDIPDAATARNTTRETLLCTITAFALLQGQDAAAAANTLHLDLSFFTSHLYRTLLPMGLHTDIELSPHSLHLLDRQSSDVPAPRTKVNVSTTIVLLLRCLSAVLLPLNARSVPPIRLAAFTKQLLTTSLHLPEKSATAMLGLLNNVAAQHGRKVGALWRSEERRGDGVFDAGSGDIESSNPFATSVWEGELLRLHYAPDVREGVRNLEGRIAEV